MLCDKSGMFSFLFQKHLTTAQIDITSNYLLNVVHRGVMARTKDNYLIMDVTSLSAKLVTGSLIVLTIFAIFLLFWYQKFGSGFPIKPR